MSAVTKKRNFTLQEKNLLIEILKAFKHIIENKKTDNACSLMKKKAWNEIAERYNTSAIISEPASGEQLRRLWTNLKARQREGLAKERQYRLATGGGGPCPDALLDPNIAEVAPALLVEINDAIDSDSTALLPEDNIRLPVLQTHPPTFTSLQRQPSPILRIMTSPVPSNMHPIQSLPSQPFTHPTLQAPFQPPPSLSHIVPDPQPPIEELSNHEKTLRVQILKREHIARESRANELHKLLLEHTKVRNQLEIEILEEKLKRAKAGAEWH